MGNRPASFPTPAPLVGIIKIYAKSDQVFPLSLRLLPIGPNAVSYPVSRTPKPDSLMRLISIAALSEFEPLVLVAQRF